MIHLDFLSNQYVDLRSPVEKATDSIAIDILSGAIAPGKRMVEQNLCDKFHLSRTPIREVLRNLESLGLLELIPNRGAIVKGFSQQDTEDAFHMKSLLYPQCVAWAIQRITEEEFAMLEETFGFMEFYTSTEDYDKMEKINRGFDTIVYNACHNRDMQLALERFDFFLQHSHWNTNQTNHHLFEILEEHRNIYQAFLSHNIEEGMDAAQIHMYKTIIRRK